MLSYSALRWYCCVYWDSYVRDFFSVHVFCAHFIPISLFIGTRQGHCNHFGVQKHTFNKALVGVAGTSMGSRMTLVVVWKSVCTMNVKKTPWEPKETYSRPLEVVDESEWMVCEYFIELCVCFPCLGLPTCTWKAWRTERESTVWLLFHPVLILSPAFSLCVAGRNGAREIQNSVRLLFLHCFISSAAFSCMGETRAEGIPNCVFSR